MTKNKKASIATLLKNQPGAKLVEILLETAYLPFPTLEKAVRIQKKLHNKKILSKILIELGYITPEDHRRITRTHGSQFLIGELICELGYIDLDDLQRAEDKLSKTANMRMGELLISLNLITDRQLAHALSEQLGLALAHIDSDMVDRKVSSQFSKKFLKQNRILPYEINEKKVSIITSEPLNKAAITEIEQQLEKTAQLFIAPQESILNLIDKLTTSNNHESHEGQQVAEVVDNIFLSALRDSASDIHMEPLAKNMRIRFRMDGVLIHKMDLPLTIAKRVITRIKVLGQMDISDTRTHQDGRISETIGDIKADFRVSTYVTIYGENLVIRVLRRDGGLKSIEQIHMDRGILERFKHDALDVPTGVIIVTGPTGSGKTTTLYSAVDYLNRPTTKIITLEDPVEYVIDGIMQCSVDNTAGRSFEKSLKAVVRQDPDVIVLGEIRDTHSASVAVQAALTGHKVLTTFHTEDAIGGLLRLIDMGIETFLISSTVVSILAQRLIRTICPECRQPYMPNKRIANLIGLDNETLRNHTFYRGTGCATCYGTGYHGRTALHELLVLNEEVRSAIIAQKPSHVVRKISCESTDLLSLMENGLYKALQGKTTIEEVYRIAPRSHSDRSVEDIIKIMGDEHDD